MISEQNIQSMELEPHVAEDASGLSEIEQALKEIEELQNNSEEQVEEQVEEQNEVEEEDQEAVLDEPEPPAEQEKKKTKLWKQKKQTYRLIEEKQVLQKEILHLKQMLDESLTSGTYHYGKSAYSDLERAKDSKKKAIENGDLDSLLEADIALTKAIHTINDLEKWAYSEGQRKSAPVQQNNYQEPEYSFNERDQEVAKDWLEDHEYLNPKSEKYDVNLASKVINFTNALDVNLQNQGRGSAIFSEQYFDTVDNYIATTRKESSKNSKSSSSVAPVGAVRNSYTSSVGNKGNTTQIVLTPDEKRICSNMGVSEKEWLKYKLEDLKKGK